MLPFGTRLAHGRWKAFEAPCCLCEYAAALIIAIALGISCVLDDS